MGIVPHAGFLLGQKGFFADPLTLTCYVSNKLHETLLSKLLCYQTNKLSHYEVLAIVSEKGGSGKTVLAVNLAVAAEAQGLATAIFDLDPRANSTVWGDHRQTKIPAVVPAQAPRLPMLLEQARANVADLVIIDTPGNAEGVAAQAAIHADAILIPCRPFGPDLISIATSVKLAQASGKPFFVVINAAPVQGVETAEAFAAVSAEGVEVCPVVLHSRKPFVSRFHEGLTALDIEPKGKAAAEVREFFLWICEKVIIIPSSQGNKVTRQQA
jgi:chromosome partitioning protein